MRSGLTASLRTTPAKFSAELCGLVLGLIRMRSSAFSSVPIGAAAQVTDAGAAWRTHIPRPENRKVGGSTPPLTTASEQGKPRSLMIFNRSLSN
jgi:hypothetical protein